MHRYAIVAIIFLIIIQGCEFQAGNERGFTSSNQEYMENFMALLEKRNISYQYQGGYLRYSTDVEPEIEKVKKLLSSTKSIKLEENAARNYFHSLLEKEGIEYLPLKKEGGVWTMWWPNNKEQEKAIELKVVEFAFKSKKRQL